MTIDADRTDAVEADAVGDDGVERASGAAEVVTDAEVPDSATSAPSVTDSAVTDPAAGDVQPESSESADVVESGTAANPDGRPGTGSRDEPGDGGESGGGGESGDRGESASGDGSDDSGFRVKLRNFEGPFDLLLELISQHRLDVTEVALHVVTDEFIAYTRELGPEVGLDQTTEFLVIAATLLDLKAARLLPSGEVEDPEDLALLEARDLLFARLLQYRAYKQVAQLFGELEAAALQRYPRSVSLEKRFEDLLPEVTLGVDAQGFAEVAATALTPRPVPTVRLDHLHDVQKVSVPGQARRMAKLLSAATGQWLTFRDLIADCENGLEIVGSFLGLLELYREQAIAFEQPEALGDLSVMWTGERDIDDLRIDKAEDYG